MKKGIHREDPAYKAARGSLLGYADEGNAVGGHQLTFTSGNTRTIQFIARPARGRTIPLSSAFGNKPGDLPAGHPISLDETGSPWSPYQWHPPARLPARFPAEDSGLVSPSSLSKPVA